ncbi:MAG TPA: hydantoinase B/oxoprolinase family protein [Acidimicrobiales bacterium]|nr:hydantoinase B/oxoprolinase family protein [Acidimicrobiales bacterium]
MSRRTSAGTRLPAVTFELISAALHSAAVEMGGVLKHSSYSPIIREMDDFSCAVFRSDGDLVAQADFIPAQLGAMSLVVKNLIERWGDAVEPGDAYLANHPYMGAMHTPDLNVIMPVFLGGRLVAWTGTTAHHIDVGGVRPGTEGPDLREVYAEGLVLPPVRLYRAGRENPDVVSIVAAAVRDPRSTLSDLRAQRAACLIGVSRIEELAGRYGTARLLAAFDEMLDSVERAVRAALSALPDGESEAEGFLDDDGAGGPPQRIHARLVKTGDELLVDLSGTAPQLSGALNVPWASTRAAVVYALRAMTDPSMATNDGILRPLEIVCPRGVLLNPEPPAAVSVRHNTCQRLADTLVRAASELWPHKAVASSTVAFFGMNLESVSPRTGLSSVMAEVVGGGTGAHAGGDGLDGVDTYMANVGLMPVEVAESDYSVRILRTELIPGSAGAGEHHGGLGLRRDYQVLERPATVTMYSEQTDPRFPPRGAAGGGDGAPSRLRLFGPDGVEVPVPSKVTMTLEPGSVVRIETSGGGGYGAPKRRPAAAEEADRADGRLEAPPKSNDDGTAHRRRQRPKGKRQAT